jgi:SAM-dependent methyltransferase
MERERAKTNLGVAEIGVKPCGMSEENFLKSVTGTGIPPREQTRLTRTSQLSLNLGWQVENEQLFCYILPFTHVLPSMISSPLARALIFLTLPVFGQDEVQINTPYVATPYPVVKAMLRLAHAKKSDVVYDLGCGDGRILIEAAKTYGAHGVGIDNNPERIREAEQIARREGLSHLLNFRVGDLYDVNLQEATLVTLYLLPEVNLKLRPKLQKQLKPGARVVTHTFDMGDWKPNQAQLSAGARIYLWKIKRPFWHFI